MVYIYNLFFIILSLLITQKSICIKKFQIHIRISSKIKGLMAFKGFVLCLVMVLVAANMMTQNAAQSGCTTTLTTLSPCLNYIMGSSSAPSTSCCSQLSTVVQSSPQCLCSLFNGGGSSYGITINQTLALSLPAACKVQTPPVSQCKGLTSPSSSSSPVASPVGSPTDSSTEGAITPASDFPSGIY